VTVTSHGEPVAKVVPIDHGDAAAKEKAWRALLKRLRHQPAMNAGPWTRDELYDD
jgi:antitoxin (DNA-binding transcriptional repressor) of toxin-antitoxin stability system